jgi:hypothetical protein
MAQAASEMTAVMATTASAVEMIAAVTAAISTTQTEAKNNYIISCKNTTPTASVMTAAYANAITAKTVTVVTTAAIASTQASAGTKVPATTAPTASRQL